MPIVRSVAGKMITIGGRPFLELTRSTSDTRFGVGKKVPLGAVPTPKEQVLIWHISDGCAYPGEPPSDPTVPIVKGLPGETPWAWQAEALAAWKAKAHVGIIEAVTGSGKTFLAMDALEHLVTNHSTTYTLVVVPSVLLQDQWHTRLRDRFPGRRIARLGGGHKESFAHGKVCVAVINSLVAVGREAEHATLLSLFEHCRRHRENRSFLIADECHHYIHAAVFKRVRELVRFDAVLALSATVGDEYEVDGLGSVVYRYTFADAIRRGDLPPLTLLNVRCRLNPDERRRYDDLTESIGEQIEYLKRLFPDELDSYDPDDNFFRQLKLLESACDRDSEESRAIRRLFILLFKRSEVIYTARDKQSAAQLLLRAMIDSPRLRKVIVFFERIETAEDSIDRLEFEQAHALQFAVARHGVWTGILHSEREREERNVVIEEFRRATRGILFACRMVDEGFDLPDVDAALLVASTKSRRQRVQRVGRVVRRGDGSKQPVVITLVCEGTTDQGVVSSDRTLFGSDARITALSPGEAVERLRHGIHAQRS